MQSRAQTRLEEGQGLVRLRDEKGKRSRAVEEVG